MLKGRDCYSIHDDLLRRSNLSMGFTDNQASTWSGFPGKRMWLNPRKPSPVLAPSIASHS